MRHVVPLTNRQVRSLSSQLFANTRAWAVPFYNRDQSRREVTTLFTSRKALCGSAVLLSAPAGNGRGQFFDVVTSAAGVTSRERPLSILDVTAGELARLRDDVILINEVDIKCEWADLARGLGLLGRHLLETQRVAFVVGDLVLQNEELLRHLPAYRFVQSFEPLDRAFLRGLIGQRLRLYAPAIPDQDIIAPELYQVLAPDGMGHVNSLRAVLSFLERLGASLRHNDQVCWLTVGLAKEHAEKTFDLALDEERQARFLNALSAITQLTPGTISELTPLGRVQHTTAGPIRPADTMGHHLLQDGLTVVTAPGRSRRPARRSAGTHLRRRAGGRTGCSRDTATRRGSAVHTPGIGRR